MRKSARRSRSSWHASESRPRVLDRVLPFGLVIGRETPRRAFRLSPSDFGQRQVRHRRRCAAYIKGRSHGTSRGTEAACPSNPCGRLQSRRWFPGPTPYASATFARERRPQAVSIPTRATFHCAGRSGFLSSAIPIRGTAGRAETNQRAKGCPVIAYQRQPSSARITERLAKRLRHEMCCNNCASCRKEADMLMGQTQLATSTRCWPATQCFQRALRGFETTGQHFLSL